MRWWMTYPMTIVDTVFKALAPVIPDRAIAGHHADLLIAALHANTKTRQSFLANFGPLGGGWGAARAMMNKSLATVCLNDGDTHNSPSDSPRPGLPIVVEGYALVPDSGGAGRHRRLKAERVVRPRADFHYSRPSAHGAPGSSAVLTPPATRWRGRRQQHRFPPGRW